MPTPRPHTDGLCLPLVLAFVLAVITLATAGNARALTPHHTQIAHAAATALGHLHEADFAKWQEVDTLLTAAWNQGAGANTRCRRFFTKLHKSLEATPNAQQSLGQNTLDLIKRGCMRPTRRLSLGPSCHGKARPCQALQLQTAIRRRTAAYRSKLIIPSPTNP